MTLNHNWGMDSRQRPTLFKSESFYPHDTYGPSRLPSIQLPTSNVPLKDSSIFNIYSQDIIVPNPDPKNCPTQKYEINCYAKIPYTTYSSRKNEIYQIPCIRTQPFGQDPKKTIGTSTDAQMNNLIIFAPKYLYL